MAWGQRVLDLILPPCCSHCAALTSIPHVLCSVCWGQIRFIQDPSCKRCGWPLPSVSSSTQQLCALCSIYPPPFSEACSIFSYEGPIRHLILNLKHRDVTHIVPCLSRFLADYGQRVFYQVDALIPVPLHRWRLFYRGFNQVTLMAHKLSQYINIPVWVNVLERFRATRPQSKLNRQERKKNLTGAFRIFPGHVSKIQGKSILLLDDVWTTGATLHECCKLLLKEGAGQVKVLTIARVIPSL